MLRTIRGGTALKLLGLLLAVQGPTGCSRAGGDGGRIGSREAAIDDEVEGAVGADVVGVMVIPEEVPAETETIEHPTEETWDHDGDGFSVRDDDDDTNPQVFPGAPEIACNGIDEDGDGVDACTPDADGDGVRSAQDCDDADPDRSPLAVEQRCNDVDENCDGFDDCDRDEDGHLDQYDPEPDVAAPPPSAPVYTDLDDRRE